MNQYLWLAESQKAFFEYPIEDWISSIIVEKYLLKALATVIGSVNVPLLSMIS